MSEKEVGLVSADADLGMGRIRIARMPHENGLGGESNACLCKTKCEMSALTNMISDNNNPAG